MKKFIYCLIVIVLAFGFVISSCGEPSPATPTGTTQPTQTAKPTETAQPTQPAKTTEPAKTTQPAQTTQPAGETPQSGGVFRFIYTEAPQGSIGVPGNMLGLAGGMAGCCLEPLFKSNRKGDIIPWLATGYQWSDDYMTLTLTLRQGVKFQDGSDWNADVCKWNWDQHKAKGVGGTQYVASTEVVDDYTFRIHLNQYQSTWWTSLYKMETGLGWIISKEAVEKNGEEYVNWHPVGSGPFKFKSYERDNYLEYERWDGYWGEKPYLDGLKYLFVADPMTAQMAFEADEGDAIWTIGQMHKLAGDLVPQGYVAYTYPGLTFCLIPSSGRPGTAYTNQKVREAVEYAIDKAKICQSVGLGYWTPLYQAAFPYHAEYIQDLKGRVYDPAKAKQLLAEAGYPDGFPTTFYAGVHLSGDHVVAIQANLQAVGIDADIDPISVGKWIELETNGWDEGLMLTPQGGQSPYATYMMRFWYKPSEPNWSQGLYWTALDRPDEMQTIVQEYIDAHGVAEQTAAGRKLIQYMYDHATVIPLWQQADMVIVNPRIKDGKWGDDSNPSPWNFTGIWMSKD